MGNMTTKEELQKFVEDNEDAIAWGFVEHSDDCKCKWTPAGKYEVRAFHGQGITPKTLVAKNAYDFQLLELSFIGTMVKSGHFQPVAWQMGYYYKTGMAEELKKNNEF